MKRPDYIKYGTAFAIIFAFIFEVVTVVFIPIPPDNKEIFIHTLGMVEGAFIGGLVAYYYTRSSKEKEEKNAEV